MQDADAQDPRYWFHNDEYLAINRARLAHLAFVVESMNLATRGLRVIEFGAGVGDHTPFWLERGCAVTITEPRDDNLAILRERFPDSDIRQFDLDRDELSGETFDIVYAYGVLYHLSDPARAIATLASACGGFLFLETCVSYGDDEDPKRVAENVDIPTQSVSGAGCRPTRPWIFSALKRHFPHVYQPGAQPDHAQFPLDWRAQAEPLDSLVRTTFVATRQTVETPALFDRLLKRQTPMPSASPSSGDGLMRVMRQLEIRAVLDVGANTGQFASTLRDGGFKGWITSFEPLNDAHATLARRAAADPRWTAIQCALGESERAATINVTSNSVSSSLLMPMDRTLDAEPATAVVDQQAVVLRRLDLAWADLGDEAVARPLLLKIDVQGLEPQVLEGASGVLQKIDAVLIEASLVPVYGGERTLEQMMPLMSELGFAPVWLQPGWSNQKTGQTYQCDILFSRQADIGRPP
ncbi:MAG: class I SAM-dependent methyltransferase [Hyphomicrobium sp.]